MKSKLTVIIVAVVLVAVIAAGVIFLPGLLNKDDDNAVPIDSGEMVKVWLLGGFTASDIDGHSISEAKAEYDEKHNIKRVTYYVDDTVANVIDVEYDSDNRIVAMLYTSEGQRIQSNEYKYNENGKVSERIFIAGSTEQPKASIKTEYIYNENNVLIKSVEGDKTTLYECNENGLRVKETVYSGDELYNYSVYEYDSNGNIKSRVTYSSSNTETMRYTYEYDSNNSLTKYAIADNQGINTFYFSDYACVEVSPEQAEALNRQQKFFTIGYIE